MEIQTQVWPTKRIFSICALPLYQPSNFVDRNDHYHWDILCHTWGQWLQPRRQRQQWNEWPRHTLSWKLPVLLPIKVPHINTLLICDCQRQFGKWAKCMLVQELWWDCIDQRGGDFRGCAMCRYMKRNGQSSNKNMEEYLKSWHLIDFSWRDMGGVAKLGSLLQHLWLRNQD